MQHESAEAEPWIFFLSLQMMETWPAGPGSDHWTDFLKCLTACLGPALKYQLDVSKVHPFASGDVTDADRLQAVEHMAGSLIQIGKVPFILLPIIIDWFYQVFTVTPCINRPILWQSVNQ